MNPAVTNGQGSGAPPPTAAKQRGVDSHLRSARVVRGYKVEANDGAIGEIADFLVDGRTWVLREIVVESGHWYSGNEIRLATEKISRISYDESTVYVDSTKAAIIEAAQMPASTFGCCEHGHLSE